MVKQIRGKSEHFDDQDAERTMCGLWVKRRNIKEADGVSINPKLVSRAALNSEARWKLISGRKRKQSLKGCGALINMGVLLTIVGLIRSLLWS
jgi:hypothetical protein